MANTSKRRGMSPVLAFILGIVFGMILLIGGVVAAVIIVLNTKVSSFEFNRNEDGSYKYINGDPDDGGLETLMDVVSFASDLMSKSDTLTIGELEHSLPIAKSLTNPIMNMLQGYVEINEDELKATPFSELGAYMQNVIMDINVSSLLDKFGGSLADNKLLGTFLYGKESEYLEYNSVKYPVFYDVYEKFGNSYSCETIDSSGLSDSQIEYLVAQDAEDGEEALYRLYFIEKDGGYLVVQKTDDGYAYVTENAEYDRYGEALGTATCTGNFYYNADGAKVVVHPVTIRSLTDGSAIENLNDIMLVDLLGGDNDKNGIVYDVLGGISIGALLSGDVDFDKVLEDIRITSFIDIEAENNIMLYLGYGLTDVKQIDGKYYAEYKNENGESKTCQILTKEKDGKLIVDKVLFEDETELLGATVQELSSKMGSITEELAIADLVKIPAPTEDSSNSIMIFLAYSIADIERDGANFKGTYYETDDSDGVDCFIEVSGENIVSAYYMDGETKVAVKKTKIADVSKQLNRLTTTLTLGDVIKIDGNSSKLMQKLAKTKISEIGNVTDTLTLGDIMEIDDSNKLLLLLKDSTISTLSRDINALSVNELYADSIYAPNTSVSSYSATMYQVVLDATDMELVTYSDYNIDNIYYVLKDGKYVLANTTGKVGEVKEVTVGEVKELKFVKLEESDFNKLGTLYTLGEGKILYNEAFLYYTKVDDSYKMVGNGGRLTEWNGTDEYYTYGAANAMWKLMLYATPESGEKYESAFSVNQLGTLANHLTGNIEDSTLRELQEAGILTIKNIDNEVPLFRENGTPTGEKRKIGDFTLADFIDNISNMVNSSI